MSLQTNCWVLRQNYGSKTDQLQMKNLIVSQKCVTCPWGGWGPERQNVIDGIYNDKTITGPRGRLSKGQDRRFVNEMNIGDIILIPFAKQNGCIVARITSNVEYSIDTGLCWSENNNRITISETGDLPFRPVGRRIEIIKDNFIPTRPIPNRMSLSKTNNIELQDIMNTSV